ncbi:unnamed protein product [Lactuca virosa]|uniref:Uncharacterized protein n=1 Tax=Lactuca virosa TaxID=75947 RepID=A0AAU9PMJ0_9ASTR|nr:unnamed protein product [Lactuca virosa]
MGRGDIIVVAGAARREKKKSITSLQLCTCGQQPPATSIGSPPSPCSFYSFSTITHLFRHTTTHCSHLRLLNLSHLRNAPKPHILVPFPFSFCLPKPHTTTDPVNSDHCCRYVIDSCPPLSLHPR